MKIHRTLRTTPAMAAGVTTRLWEVRDLVALWEAEEARLACIKLIDAAVEFICTFVS
jgi:hypothetical protein